MGMCYSLRQDPHPPIPHAYGHGEADASQRGDLPPGRAATKEDLRVQAKEATKRSKSIDKYLKAEKREYRQTHRLLLLAGLNNAAGWQLV